MNDIETLKVSLNEVSDAAVPVLLWQFIRAQRATIAERDARIAELLQYMRRVLVTYDRHGRWECRTCNGIEESHEDGCELHRLISK